MHNRIAPLLAASLLTFAVFAIAPGAQAQKIVVLVNDDPISDFDVAQRQRWMSRTNNFGERMKAALTSEAIKAKFKTMMVAANPRSQAEAQQAADRIKKQLIDNAKQEVLGGGGSRKAAIDALIEDRLKIQAAKKLTITIEDSEVEAALGQRATNGGGGKPDLTEFYKQFENDGITRKTVQSIVRAQLAWRDVIRRQYGSRIQSLLSAIPTAAEQTSDSDLQFDVRVVRLAVSGSGDQKAVSQRLLEAENLKDKFVSCTELAKQATLFPMTTVKAMDKARVSSFPKDVQPLIVKATAGQMTPPVLVGDAVETYAICRKVSAAKPKTKAEEKPDVRQAEYERFSRRYLQDLKQAAAIDFRGS